MEKITLIKKIKYSKESNLLIAGFFLLALLVTIVVWSVSYLIFQLDAALKISLPDDATKRVIHFELEKFEELNLIER